MQRTSAKAIVTNEDNTVALRQIWKGCSILRFIKNIGAAWLHASVKCMRRIWERGLKCSAVLVSDFEGLDQNEQLEEIR